MLSFSHTIISLPFGFAFTNVFVIFLGAFLMHLVSDMFLHWNIYPHHFKRYPFFLVSLDVVSGLVASYIILDNSLFAIPILVAIAGGNAPDILHAAWSFMGKNRQKRSPKSIQAIFHFHEIIQRETPSPLVGGLWQIVFCSIAIILTLSLR
ncbi:MAG: hypothetical protein O3A36_01505 [bacterium]|nr:hypothetical protein [bacterium]